MKLKPDDAATFALILLVMALAFAVLSAAVSTKAKAHDDSHPELNSWFDHLASKKGPCCSFADGVVVKDADWDTKDGHYRVLLQGDWIDVPDDAVITEPNRAGHTMVWPLLGLRQGHGVFTIRCFMPGSMT